MSGEAVRGKMFEVTGDDPCCLRGDRGGEDVSIVRVGQFEGRDQPLIPRDQASLGVKVHQLAGALDLGARYIGVVATNRGHPLVMDIV